MHSYRLGETSLRFESDDASWLAYVSDRFASFRDPEPDNAFVVRFECTSATRPQGLTSPLSTYVEAPQIETHDTGFTATTATTFAEVNLDARRARVEGPPALYPVDNLFRHLLPSLAEQGALVHGAALAKNGRGVLACGPSGAGKSTLAAIAGRDALCDELTAVRASEKAYRLESMPFWQARPGDAELVAILLLRHGREHALARIAKADALRRVTQQVLWPIEIPSAMERAFGHISAILENVPVFELSFRPEPSAWAFVEAEVLS